MKTSDIIRTMGMDDRGFTLIELMVALLIGLFVVGMTIVILDGSARTYRTQERVADMQQDARAALEIMARDIRMAGYDPMRGSGARILTAQDTVLVFQVDGNMSNHIETDFPAENIFDETIAYSFDEKDHEIDRGINNEVPNAAEPGGKALVSNVRQLKFAYFNEDGTQLNPADNIRADIRRVSITVTCEEKDTKGNPISRTLTTQVGIRNRVILPRRGLL